MALVSIFLSLQILLLFIITFHDWVHLPPLTDIRSLEKHSSAVDRVVNSAIFFLTVCIPLILTWVYWQAFQWWVLACIASFYGLLTLGTILSWWIPYLFGGYSEEYKLGFAEYKTTHHFLPTRGDNIVPNTLHVVLHLCIWTCFAISLYLLINN
jgi:hypothetical protein